MDIVINLNKPKDISSQQAVIKVKRLFTVKKAGHAGTLDPIATGVLIVCLNEATKITRFLSDLDKEYIVRLKLGERTDTYDLTGRIVDKTDCLLLKEADIHRVLNNFIGRIKQTPPMYSAIKIGGKPLYKLARRGMDIKRPDRTINIYGIDLIGFKQPYLDLKISCSKGTYIRTLCDDIGKSLGVGAHMVLLERTRVGKFRIEDSVSLEELKYKKTTLHSIDSAISHLNEIILDEGSYYKAKNGMPIITTKIPLHPPLLRGGRRGLQINQYVRLKGPENNLFGIGRVERDRIKIERLLN
ncbi:MAG: tRNA pseudouridine(55) synthase TruB [Thermodesulfovibrionales bacterium]|nr:tRNA pseudouridine(55) synthase TruB [Thermodesulfovibrionales bacterium]